MIVVLQWVRFVIAVIFMLGGVTLLLTALVGMFRLDNNFNRIHVGAKCDTFGILLIFSSLIVMSDWRAASIKMIAIILFFWLTIPVASHLIARIEFITNPRIVDDFEVLHDDDR